eukprot:10433374-Karenia_brevis.AAC.1
MSLPCVAIAAWLCCALTAPTLFAALVAPARKATMLCEIQSSPLWPHVIHAEVEPEGLIAS